MQIERLRIADLHPAEKNTRVHSDKQIDELVRSFRMFGQIRPIIIDESNVIWCGNGFYEAASRAGEVEIDCYRISGLSEPQKKKLMLADNQTFMLGATNSNVIDEFLAELSDFDIPGYDPVMLEELYGDIETATAAMASYGVVDEETVQSISAVEERRNEAVEQRVIVHDEAPAYQPVAGQSLPPTIQSTNGMLNVPTNSDTRPFIVCPRCGEKIWV